MAVEKSSRARVAFRASCRAAIYTLLIISSPLTILLAIAALIEIGPTLRAVLGTCIAALAIRILVRWINRKDRPAARQPRKQS